jgi:hypothetical protein
MATIPEKELVEAETLQLLADEKGKRVFVRRLLDGLSAEALDTLARRLKVPEDTPKVKELAQKLGVRTYSKEEKKALELVSMLNYFEYRRKLLANALPNASVSEMLGVSRQTPHDRVNSGFLLGILDNNTLKFPEWQFDPEGPNGVVAGLPEVLAALKCGTFAKISWLASPSPIFDGNRPIDALRMGLVEDVIHEAAAVGKN